jgi:hypothetical protein
MVENMKKRKKVSNRKRGRSGRRKSIAQERFNTHTQKKRG